ncbi:MAG: outer membrane beta-barrel protein [Bacteroidetes bacterium]|nr:outer membrane beta-barrel protein [Bacteroidota bacterium]
MKLKYALILMIFPLILQAQHHSAGFKMGLFDPSATDAGFIIGYEGSKYIDDRFDIGWSVDWFNKNYVDKNLVSEFNSAFGIPDGTINELRAKTNIHSIPLMGTATAHLFQRDKVSLYVTAGVGLDVLLIFYKNYENPRDDELKGAFDFCWRLGTGVTYELGYRSEIFGELAYHHSEPSWTYEVTDEGRTRTFERVFDMSGIMARIGFRFYY